MERQMDMEQAVFLQKKINEKKQTLHIKMAGKTVFPVANGKLRVLAVFRYGNHFERRFPMEAICYRKEAECFFSVEKTIELANVFYDFTKESSEECVEVTFEYCDAEGVWHSIEEQIMLSSDLFCPRKTTSEGYRVYNKVMYGIGTLLLPWFMLDGYFVQKGYKPSLYRKETLSGKKGMFYHAHDIVHSLSGYGYSKRERNTNYFVKKYNSYKKKNRNPQNILFLSERQKESGGNLDCVERALAERGIRYKEIIDTRLIDNLPRKKIRSIAKEVAEAKVVILEDFYPQINRLTLSKKTTLVQLWHACGAFKMFGLSELGRDGNLTQDTKNHRNYSVAFTSGTKMVPFYSEAFGINPKDALPFGVPRTDIFFDNAYKEQVKKRLYEKYPLLKEKRVVLFAPTFRGGGNKDAYYPMEKFCVDGYMDAMPEDVVLIVKNHPFVKQSFSWSEKYNHRVIDLADAESINDLLFITSLLITDYSSSIFEASLLEIPMLFYVFDLEEYVAGRDFYFDFAHFVPGEKVDMPEQLAMKSKECLDGTNIQSKENMEKFRQYFLDALDGKSTERIADYIKSVVS